MSPQRIQLRRTAGWRKPADAIVVSRPTRWGNPYAVGWCCRTACDAGPKFAKHWHVYAGDEPIRLVATAEEALGVAVEMFRRHFAEDEAFLQRVRAELAGRDLACWCQLDLPCHGDVLLEWANQ